MGDAKSGQLANISKSLSNPNRVKIFKIVSNNPSNISNISKKINLSYKSTLQNISNLERAGLVERKKVINKTGSESLIVPVKDLTPLAIDAMKLGMIVSGASVIQAEKYLDDFAHKK